MTAQIEKLREVTRRCLSGEPLDDSLAVWLGQSLAAFLDRRSPTVDQAFGLRFAQGGVPWWREEAIRRRDAALRLLAERHHAGVAPSAQAQRICRAALRYAASAWLIDRHSPAMPPHYAGSEKELLWVAFKSGATMPICERQLRNILAR
jgi:hypothetical protein